MTMVLVGLATLGTIMTATAPNATQNPSKGRRSVARLVSLPVKVTFPDAEQPVSYLFQKVNPGFSFNEVIPSWNLDSAENGAIQIELRAHTAQGISQWFTLAEWSGDANWSPRQSVNGQKDEFARVATDTLVLKSSANAVDCRITLRSKPEVPKSKLKLLTLSFCDKTSTSLLTTKSSLKKSHFVDVPQRAQNSYPNGKVLCSATSTSMLLWHWSKVLGDVSIDRDVPEVEANVWDPVYKGAGNWPFNTAYFGSFPKMRACVSRFTEIADLEKLTAAGIPVACSVSFDMLRGRPLSPTESGHLILVVGFQADGTPIVNDPAFKDGVRKTYSRSDFEKAWTYSHRTVYLMVPDSKPLPRDTRGIWNFRTTASQYQPVAVSTDLD